MGLVTATRVVEVAVEGITVEVVQMVVLSMVEEVEEEVAPHGYQHHLPALLIPPAMAGPMVVLAILGKS